MSDKIQWLKEESSLWEKEGMINSGQRERILARYPVESKGEKIGLSTIFIAILGALCIGVGLILVVSYNWSTLPIFVRLAILFLLLLSGGMVISMVWIKKRDQIAYCEGAGIYLYITIHASITLGCQIFQLNFEWFDELLLCAVVMLPVIYLMKLKAAMVLYIVPIALDYFGAEEKALIVLLLILPYILSQLFTQKNRWILRLFFVMTVIIFGTFLFHLEAIMDSACLFAMLMFFFDLLFRVKNEESYFQTPLKFCGIFTVSIYICSSFSYAINQHWLGIPDARMFVVVLYVICFAGYGWMRYLLYEQKKVTALCAGDLFAGLSFVLLLICIAPFLKFLSAPMIIGTGMYYIIDGGKKLSIKKVNYGAFMMVIFVMLVLFSTNSGVLGKGIFLMAMGAFFLVLNIKLSQKKKLKRKI